MHKQEKITYVKRHFTVQQVCAFFLQRKQQEYPKARYEIRQVYLLDKDFTGGRVFWEVYYIEHRPSGVSEDKQAIVAEHRWYAQQEWYLTFPTMHFIPLTLTSDTSSPLTINNGVPDALEKEDEAITLAHEKFMAEVNQKYGERQAATQTQEGVVTQQ